MLCRWDWHLWQLFMALIPSAGEHLMWLSPTDLNYKCWRAPLASERTPAGPTFPESADALCTAVIVGLAKYAQWKLRLADEAKAKVCRLHLIHALQLRQWQPRAACWC